jgi:hypothetical protein
MSKTLVRGLELIEDRGLYGPMTISELARRSGVHVSIVSLTVSMLEPEGWVVRVDLDAARHGWPNSPLGCRPVLEQNSHAFDVTHMDAVRALSNGAPSRLTGPACGGRSRCRGDGVVD